MIRFDNVSKVYPGSLSALQKVNFHLEKGEMAFLTGPSGAGKSTLLKLISMLERPSAGDVILNGRNVSQVKKADIPFLRRDIGIIFQDHRLLVERTVFDNVALPLIPKSLLMPCLVAKSKSNVTNIFYPNTHR